MKNLLIKFINKNLINFYLILIIIVMLIIFFNLNIKNNYNLNINTLNDLDISTSTDFEDFTIILNDSLEVILHDYSIISDGFIDLFFYFSSFCITSSIIKNLR